MRVVIVEDSLLIREGLTRLLEVSGASVAAAVGEVPAFLSGRRRAETGRGDRGRPTATLVHR